MERLQATVAELERQLAERMVGEGLLPDERPRLLPEAQIYYRDFHRLLQFTGMGAVNLIRSDITELAREYGEPIEEVRSIMYGLLSDYREIVGELSEKK